MVGRASITSADDVVVSPALSVATAVSVYTPDERGVNVVVYGGEVTGVPIAMPFSKNCTWVIVPEGAEASAVSVMGCDTVDMLPACGEMMLTVGGGSVTTVTLIVGLVATLPSLSVTSAEIV